MKCFYPVIKPSGEQRPCGQCQACMINKQLQWRFRLEYEILQNDAAFWLTLQYDDDHLTYVNGQPAVNKTHCQNYFRKFRKWIEANHLNVTFKYFLVSEYGPETRRPHYHCLMLFKLPSLSFNGMLELRQRLYEACKNRWYHGHVEASLFHRGVIRYLTKYVFKTGDDFVPPEPLFRLISKGIGVDYLERCNIDQLIRDEWRTPDGLLPRYFRDKLLPLNKSNIYYQRNKDIRSDIFSRSLDKIYRSERKKLSDCGNDIDNYIKRQHYLLMSQKRLIERKQKQKYG